MTTNHGEIRARKQQLQRNLSETDQFSDDNKKGKISVKDVQQIQNQLGFFNWIAIFASVAVIYAFVVWQDQRMPDVRPSNQYKNFSEIRARQFLNQITNLGPRPSGSEAAEKHAFRLIKDKITEMQQIVDRNGVNRLEYDVQRPSGCFDLKFLSVFTLCYHKVTNVIARIGPKSGPTDFSVLINCHFDTLPDTPGATDDAVSCAIMMDVLDVLAHSEKALEHDVLFLFNGAEENFLQASHGFISEHPWRHSIRAFINLEGCGSGGREILFQTGPGESWLIKTYMENAPHPHCSVMGQEIFQLGIIPSDTDFRIFRDYGRISGFDIAYIRNGWVYHTEFDRPEFIDSGAIQRSGDNILAVTKALIRSPYLKQPADFNEGSKWVFFDIVGLFIVFCNVNLAIFLNYITLLSVAFLIFFRLNNGIYTLNNLFTAFIHQFFAFGAMLSVGLGIVLLVSMLNITMSWYSMPELVFPLYILPMLSAAFWAHSVAVGRLKNNMFAIAEKAQYDSTIVIWSFVLFLLNWFRAASSFFFLLHVFFPLLREPLIFVFQKIGIIKDVTPRILLRIQFLCLIPLIVIIASYTQLLFDFFVPVMGRFGNKINPELVIMPFALLIASTLMVYTNNLIYISRKLNFMVKFMVTASVFGIVIIATTRIGVPYKYSDESPRVRRVIILHARRSIYNFDGNLQSMDNGLFVVSLDYRGTEDLPEHTFLQGAGKPNCSHTTDEYCQLPYYTAIHELFPPDRSRWVPLPNGPPLAKPLDVKLLQRQLLSDNMVNLTISIRGGSDKASLHITPLNGFQLKHWSFTPFNPETFHTRPRVTYFVFTTYGYEAPEERVFWILLENTEKKIYLKDIANKSTLELAVATHYVHGKDQNSDTLLQLRSLIVNRRRTPHAGVGFWRWAMTVISGNSEIVVHTY